MLQHFYANDLIKGEALQPSFIEDNGPPVELRFSPLRFNQTV